MITLVCIIKDSEPISLRIIDWFVTNYSKNNVKKIFNDTKFDIYNNYKSQLKAYNKKLFDPFCRYQKDNKISKFEFYYDDNSSEYIVTTIGQLNFFKWALENDIIEYVSHIYEELKDDIKKKHKLEQKKKPNQISICKNIITHAKRQYDYSIYF